MPAQAQRDDGPGEPRGAAAAGEPVPGRAPARTSRGRRRRDEPAEAAAAIVLEQGPAALSHRAVAARARASLSATTYYFADLDELLAAGGELLARRWAEHARAVVEAAGAPAPGAAAPLVDAVVAAVLPDGDDEVLRAHYAHLVGAGRLPALARAYAEGRSGLDDALAALGVEPALAVAVVDGAAVSALSEGRDVRDHARRVVRAWLGPGSGARPPAGAPT